MAAHLSGTWKEKDGNQRIAYKYWFEGGKGFRTELELLQGDVEYTVIDEHPIIEIIEHRRGFKLRFTDLHSQWTSRIKFLDEKTLVLKTDKKKTEFVKELD